MVRARVWTWALLLAVAAFAAVAFPLLTYLVSLAAFGLAHVLSELRYVDRRFGPRVGRSIAASLAVVLAVIALGRLARRFDLLDPISADVLELAAGLGAVLVVVPVLRGTVARVTAAVAGITLAIGAALAPALALTVLAVAHNFTPVGFVVDATRGRERRVALVAASVVFALVPLAILSGVPWRLCAALGVGAPEFNVLPAGPLAEHMRAYLPAGALDQPWAMHAFAACVFLQCAHYLFVIAILPTTLPAHARGYLPWPAASKFAALVLAAAAVAFVGFVGDFSTSRSWYGVLAAVHAWVEIPLLLLAIGVSASASSPLRTTPH